MLTLNDHEVDIHRPTRAGNKCTIRYTYIVTINFAVNCTDQQALISKSQ